MVVVPRPFPSSVVAARHIEGAGRRTSGLGGVGIRMRTVHSRALILRVLSLRAVHELVVAVFQVFLRFVMRLGVASPLLHGATRCLLVCHLRVVPAHVHLLALVPSHRPRRSPRMLVRHKRRGLVQRDGLLLLLLLLLCLLLLLLLLLLCLSGTAPVHGVTLREACVLLHYWWNLSGVICLKVQQKQKHLPKHSRRYASMGGARLLLVHSPSHLSQF